MIRASAYIWIGPLVAMVVAQVLKPVLVMLRLRRWNWQRMREPGGMPSSHTALVVALVTELWLRQGGRNPILAIAVLVALLVMYDAAGVRWQTGRQAAVLNRLLHDLRGQALAANASAAQNGGTRMAVPEIPPLSVAKMPWWLTDWPELNERIGHRPVEVLGGAIVGIGVALYLH